MGGDHGPAVTVPACLEFLESAPEASVVLVGIPESLEAALAKARPAVRGRISIRPATEVVDMDEPPADALRKKKDSSMRVAINLVKDGTANACVSAGNTGALMAIARFVLKTLPGIDRPAIASRRPETGDTLVLDLGANVNCTSEQLITIRGDGRRARLGRQRHRATTVTCSTSAPRTSKQRRLKGTAELLKASSTISATSKATTSIAHDRCRRLRRLRRQRDAEDVGGLAHMLYEFHEDGIHAISGRIAAAIVYPVLMSFSAGSIRAATTGQRSSGSRVSSSRATAVPTPSPSPTR
jgi:hypothetical protein